MLTLLVPVGFAPHKVHALPEVDALSSDMFAGFLDAKRGSHHLFYTFVTSQSASASSDPLLVWTNGGPGCSSMEGFFSEHGPYLVQSSSTTLRHNPFAWNKFANVLFIEHPVGVGFSFADNASDYSKISDQTAADDLYDALRDFLAKYPYSGRDLYLTGESYGGVYMPHLASKIALNGHDKTLAGMLRGIALGNPVFNCALDDDQGEYYLMKLNMFYYHGMLAYQGPYRNFLRRGCASQSPVSIDCHDLFVNALRSVGSWSQDIASPAVGLNLELGRLGQTAALNQGMRTVQAARWQQRRQQQQEQQQQRQANLRGIRMMSGAHTLSAPDGVTVMDSAPLTAATAARSLEEGVRTRSPPEKEVRTMQASVEPAYDPDNRFYSFCTGNGTLAFGVLPNANSAGCVTLSDRQAAYLNRADVQAALNVNVSVSPAFGRWETCASSQTWWNYAESMENTLTSFYEPLFRALPAEAFRVLIFSGDLDVGSVPHAETQQCLSELVDAMSMPRTQKWTAWGRNGILLGYWEQFERYTLATVKGAGHMAPTNQPMTSYEMLYRWLASGNLSAAVTPSPRLA